MLQILYVDDEIDLLTIGKSFIEMNGEFSVDTADSASAAMERLKLKAYDVIVSDYQMPAMDGIEFLKLTRSSGYTVPFIIYTGRGREEVVIQAYDSGADFYVQKGGEPGAQFAELCHKIHQSAQLHQAEMTIRESEEKYRLLVENANEAILIAQDGRILFSNHRLADILGIGDEKDLVGTSIYDFIYPDDRALVESRYDQRLKGENIEDAYELRYVNSRGDTGWVFIHVTLISWKNRPAFLVLLDDITARKKAEEDLYNAHTELLAANEKLTHQFSLISRRNEELSIACEQIAATEEAVRKNEELLTMAIEASGIGLWDWNVPTGEVKVNERWARISGYTQEALQPVNIQTLMGITHPDDIEKVRYALRKHFNHETPVYQCEARMKHKDGHYQWIIDRGKVTEWADDGNPVHVTGTRLDITFRKKAEETLRNANRQMKLLTSITRHGILNDIMVAEGYLMSMDGPAGFSDLDTVHKIRQALEKIKRQIQFTREYEDLGLKEPQWQDLGCLLESLKVPAGITLQQCQCNGEIFGDPMLPRVFENLLDNSLRHGGEGMSSVRVGCSTSDKGRHILWEDNGCGIPAGDKEKIFSHGYGKGTGLGLFLVREILEITGITIKEVGEEGMGARFEILVPKIDYRDKASYKEPTPSDSPYESAIW